LGAAHGELAASLATHLARLELLRDAHQAWARLRPLWK
jgi:hypothetical protein